MREISYSRRWGEGWGDSTTPVLVGTSRVLRNSNRTIPVVVWVGFVGDVECINDELYVLRRHAPFVTPTRERFDILHIAVDVLTQAPVLKILATETNRDRGGSGGYGC